MEKIRFADAEARAEARATVAIFDKYRVVRRRAATTFYRKRSWRSRDIDHSLIAAC